MNRMQQSVCMAWQKGNSVADIIKELGFSMDVPPHIKGWTKDTIVCWMDGARNKPHFGKIIQWEKDYCIVEYAWNDYPVKRMVLKEAIPLLEELSGK